MARLSDQALVASDEAAQHLDPAGFDPSRIEDRLQELLALEENWNSYRAKRVTPEAAALTGYFAKWLGSMGCTPWICPLSDGGLNIERAGKDDYSVEVTPSGRVTLVFEEIAAGHAESILQHAFDITALKPTARIGSIAPDKSHD